MMINNFDSEQAILKEIGLRIKEYRISLGLTQVELADKCGISSSTEVRIENGEDSKFSNYIKILSSLNLLDNLELMVPKQQPNYKYLYENKSPKQRVRSKTTKSNNDWVWGEDR